MWTPPLGNLYDAVIQHSRGTIAAAPLLHHMRSVLLKVSYGEFAYASCVHENAFAGMHASRNASKLALEQRLQASYNNTIAPAPTSTGLLNLIPIVVPNSTAATRLSPSTIALVNQTQLDLAIQQHFSSQQTSKALLQCLGQCGTGASELSSDRPSNGKTAPSATAESTSSTTQTADTSRSAAPATPSRAACATFSKTSRPTRRLPRLVQSSSGSRKPLSARTARPDGFEIISEQVHLLQLQQARGYSSRVVRHRRPRRQARRHAVVRLAEISLAISRNRTSQAGMAAAHSEHGAHHQRKLRRSLQLLAGVCGRSI